MGHKISVAPVVHVKQEYHLIAIVFISTNFIPRGSSDLLPNVPIGINLYQCVQRLRLLDLTLVQVFRLQDPT